VTGLALTDPGTLAEAPGASSVVPNQNVGNLRDATGILTHQYNPIVVDGSVTYNLESFPLYTGAFPIKFAGDYINNPDGGDANEGFSAGVTFGKSGKKGLWDLSYRYKYLEGDAWFEELVDSDFGAVYSSAYRGGSKNGYSAGTNVRGHIIKATYSPYDSMTIGITYFLTEVIDLPAPNPKIDTGRLQADVSWKF
jgi:hypothetical protein